MQMVQQDPLENYLDSVFVLSHSQSTIASYRTGVNKFRAFLRERYTCDEHQMVSKVKNEEPDAYAILNEFVKYLDKIGFKPTTIKTWLASVKGYMRHLGIKIYNEEFKQTVRLPKSCLNREEALTKEILVRLLRNVSPKLQAVILVAVASGMRIGEIVQLTIEEIDFSSKPTIIHIRGETAKGRRYREAFLTTEATTALKDYLKGFHGWKEGGSNEHLRNKPIFGRSTVGTRGIRSDMDLKRGLHLTVENLLQKMLVAHLKKIPDLNRYNPNGMRVIHFHAFRKYFRTVVGNVCGRDFAEDIIGHKFYLSTYYNLSEEQKRELYLKAEPELTISYSIETEKSIKDLQAKVKELEEWKERFENGSKSATIQVPNFMLR